MHFSLVNISFQQGEFGKSARWLLEATMLTIYITLLVYGNLCSCAVALHYVNACCGHSERSLAVDLGVAYQGTTCCMIPHLQIEKELASGELIDLTPGLFQRRMLYWHRFAPEKLRQFPEIICLLRQILLFAATGQV